VRVLVALFGLPAALVAGVIVFFTIGEVEAVIVLVAVVLLAFVLASTLRRSALALVVLVEVAAIGFGGWFITDQALTIADALRTTTGPADPADPLLLANAEGDLDLAMGEAGFRLDLHETEITAVVQDGLVEAEAPLRRVEIDIVDTDTPGVGQIDFFGEFKSGDLTVHGTVETTIEAGAVSVEVVSVEMGSLNLPKLGESAMEDAIDDLLGSVTDINELLADSDVDVQSVTIGNDRIVVTGTQPSGSLITSASLLDDLRLQTATLASGTAPPPERFGPGIVNGTSAEGARYYVALGDSLAANVGVSEPRDGYVSRLHAQLQLRDGTDYGLRNFAVSGETSGTMLRSGQLDRAVEFISTNDVAYITIYVGANDLLGHLGSADCSADIENPACRSRIADAFESYEANIEEILTRLHDAAPEATIVFLRAYNPFSLGFGTGVAFEAQSNETLDALNDVAAAAAADHAILVADGFTPMLGTAASTTHMVDDPPDIHPNAAGYDILAAAILDAL
jgi:lysophospholipase L1-like esterase